MKPSPTIKKQIRIGQSGLYHWKKPELLNIQSIKTLSSFSCHFQFIGKFNEQWSNIGNSENAKKTDTK